MQIQATDCKVGTRCEVNGELYVCTDYVQQAQGRGRGIVNVRLRNLRTGNVQEMRFRSNETIERVIFDNRKMEYLYQEETGYVFMDLETYEQIPVPEPVVGNLAQYIKPNTEVEVSFYKNEPVLINIGEFVELQVVEAPPGLKGDTATGATKTVTLETGLQINVPLFINEGDILKIDTRSGEYVSRA